MNYISTGSRNINILMPYISIKFSSFKRFSTSCDVIEKEFAKQIGPLHFAMVTTHCA